MEVTHSTIQDIIRMLREAKSASPGEIIVNIGFPESLGRGEKITGTITVRNPLSTRAVVGGSVTTVWNGYLYSYATELSPGQTTTLLFPREFGWRDPVNAPDPVMPDRDATLYFRFGAISTTEQRIEETYHTIKLRVEWWEQEFLGIPIWAWLVGGGALTAVVAVGGIIAHEESRKRMMLLAMLRGR